MKNYLKLIVFVIALGWATFSASGQGEAYKFSKVIIEPEVDSIMKAKWSNEFVQVTYPKQYLDNVYDVKPGENIQAAIDAANEAGGGVVILKEGTHILESTLTLKSKVTIVGEGREKTILQQGATMDNAAFNAEDKPQITDVKQWPADVKILW